MTETVLAPTAEVLACIPLLEEAIRLCLSTRESIQWSAQHEVDHEAHRLMFMIIRHTESVTELARRDLVLFPSAMVLARAALDITATIIWLTEPEELLDAEARWMAKLKEYLNRVERLKQILAAEGRPTRWIEEQAKDLQEKYDRTLTKFPQGYVFPKMDEFKVDKALASLNIPQHYAHYILGSQFTHGGMMSTEIYRGEVCGDKTLLEWVTPEYWVFPFYVCWHSIAVAWMRILARTGGDTEVFRSSGLQKRMLQTLEALRTSGASLSASG
jgi:hypothetical protein